MPNTVPVNDSARDHPLDAVARPRPQRARLCHPAATVGSMGESLTGYLQLKAAGAVAFSDDGKPILGDDIMRKALAAAAAAGLPVIQHAEDTRLTGGCSMNAGPLAFRLGLRGMSDRGRVPPRRTRHPPRRRAGETQAPPPRAHLSTASALDAMRRARRQGLHVTCEVAPHHFLLTEDAVAAYDTNAKMNPPLRSEADRDAIIAGILDGTVDCIATDHAPHAAHEKEAEFERAPNGITGLETALGLSLALLHKQHGLSLSRMLALLSAQPAALLNLSGRGILAPGAFADVLIFDPNTEWPYRAADSKSKSKNTPFDGWSMGGKIDTTISEGRVTYSPDATPPASGDNL